MGCGAVFLCTLLHKTSSRDAETSGSNSGRGAVYTPCFAGQSSQCHASQYLQPLMRYCTAPTRSPRVTRIMFMVIRNKLTLNIQ